MAQSKKREFSHSMVDLSTSLCHKLPEGKLLFFLLSFCGLRKLRNGTNTPVHPEAHGSLAASCQVARARDHLSWILEGDDVSLQDDSDDSSDEVIFAGTDTCSKFRSFKSTDSEGSWAGWILTNTYQKADQRHTYFPFSPYNLEWRKHMRRA